MNHKDEDPAVRAMVLDLAKAYSKAYEDISTMGRESMIHMQSYSVHIV